MSIVSGSGFSTVQLPNDLLAIIVSYLDDRSLRQIRFCCRWLAEEASRYLFDELYVEMRAKDLERVIAIANSSFIANNSVKVLSFGQTPRLPELSIQEWYSESELDQLSREFHSKSSDNEEEDNKAEPLDSRNISKREEFSRFQEQLFQEYEAQRNEPSLYDCLHAPGPRIPENVETAPQDRTMSTSRLKMTSGELQRFQKACIGFEEAFQKFPNLQRLFVTFRWSEQHSYWYSEIFPGSYPGIYWCAETCLHGYYSSPFYGLEKKRAVSEETALLAFVLRALGKRNASNRSLISLSLSFWGDRWWGLQDLEYAWIPPEEEDDKGNVSCLSQAAPAKNVTLMDDAFAHLREIRVSFKENREMPQFMAALGRLLRKASGLARLELKYAINYDPGWKDLDLLTEINNCAGLSTITDLCLTGFDFSETSILHMLSLAASSLRSVTLRTCTLLGKDSAWPHCYEMMRLIPFLVLNHLDFRNCWQKLEDRELLDAPMQKWSPKDIYSGSMVIHFMEPYHDRPVGYSSAIYDYILGKTNSMPPLQRFDNSPLDRLSDDDMIYNGSRWPRL